MRLVVLKKLEMFLDGKNANVNKQHFCEVCLFCKRPG